MRRMWVMVAGMGMAGCAPAYTAMSQHTLDAGEHRQVDVLWVQRGDGTLLRCTKDDRGPVCAAVRNE
jgi:hypothetical protein